MLILDVNLASLGLPSRHLIKLIRSLAHTTVPDINLMWSPTLSIASMCLDSGYG
jgi:hypothetical protein